MDGADAVVVVEAAGDRVAGELDEAPVEVVELGAEGAVDAGEEDGDLLGSTAGAETAARESVRAMKLERSASSTEPEARSGSRCRGRGRAGRPGERMPGARP